MPHRDPADTGRPRGYSQSDLVLRGALISMVRLTWDGGYLDYWIGYVGFYRHKV